MIDKCIFIALAFSIFMMWPEREQRRRSVKAIPSINLLFKLSGLQESMLITKAEKQLGPSSRLSKPRVTAKFHVNFLIPLLVAVSGLFLPRNKYLIKQIGIN